MTRVLILPNPILSPRALELIPATSRALYELRAEFEVEIFTRSTVRSAPPATADWRDEVSRLRRALAPDTHLVAVDTDALALLALSGWQGPGSLVMSGSPTYTKATLRAWGLDDIASMVESLGTGDSIRFVAFLMPEASDRLRRRLVSVLDEDINWQARQTFLSSFSEVNLLNEDVEVRVPTLFLERTKWEYSHLVRRGVLTFVPHAEVGQLQGGWPDWMHEEASGREFAQSVIAFIHRQIGAVA
jgi:hypothetical protein